MKTLALITVAVLSLVAIGGQTTTGVIVGTVRDSTGVALLGVNITATNSQTGQRTSVVSNRSGDYVFSNMPNGVYFIMVDAPGFFRQTSYGQLGPSSELRRDFSLSLLASPRSPFSRPANIEILADRQSLQGDVASYRGNVQMTTDSVILHADELDYNVQTRRAEVRGNVSVQVREIGPRMLPLH